MLILDFDIFHIDNEVLIVFVLYVAEEGIDAEAYHSWVLVASVECSRESFGLRLIINGEKGQIFTILAAVENFVLELDFVKDRDAIILIIA